MPCSMYPNEDKLSMTDFLMKLLLCIKKSMGKAGQLNPRNLFPALMAADNSYINLFYS